MEHHGAWRVIRLMGENEKLHFQLAPFSLNPSADQATISAAAYCQTNSGPFHFVLFSIASGFQTRRDDFTLVRLTGTTGERRTPPLYMMLNMKYASTCQMIQLSQRRMPGSQPEGSCRHGGESLSDYMLTGDTGDRRARRWRRCGPSTHAQGGYEYRGNGASWYERARGACSR